MKLQITRGSCLTHSCNKHLLSPCYILGSVLSVWLAERNTTISLPSWSLHSSWRGTDNKNLNHGQGNCRFLKSHSSGYLLFLLFGNINSLSPGMWSCLTVSQGILPVPTHKVHVTHKEQSAQPFRISFLIFEGPDIDIMDM